MNNINENDNDTYTKILIDLRERCLSYQTRLNLKLDELNRVKDNSEIDTTLEKKIKIETILILLHFGLIIPLAVFMISTPLSHLYLYFFIASIIGLSKSGKYRYDKIKDYKNIIYITEIFLERTSKQIKSYSEKKDLVAKSIYELNLEIKKLSNITENKNQNLQHLQEFILDIVNDVLLSEDKKDLNEKKHIKSL